MVFTDSMALKSVVLGCLVFAGVSATRLYGQDDNGEASPGQASAEESKSPEVKELLILLEALPGRAWRLLQLTSDVERDREVRRDRPLYGSDR